MSPERTDRFIHGMKIFITKKKKKEIEISELSWGGQTYPDTFKVV